MALSLPGGIAAEPPDRPGLSGFVADWLDEGAGGRDAIDLSEAFASCGSVLRVDAGADGLFLSATTLTRFSGPVLALLADVVTRPHLSDPDFARVRELRIGRLKELAQQASAAADRVNRRQLFGAHPYAHGSLGTTRMIAGLLPDEARGHWVRLARASSATLVIAGDVAPDIVDQAERAFGVWQGSGDLQAIPPLRSTGGGPAIHLVDRPGAPQSELRVGVPAPSRIDAPFASLVTLNACLGGPFSSRLNRELRESRGITYGVHSAVDLLVRAGTLVVSTGVARDATAEAIDVVLGTFAAIAADGVGADELRLAQSALTRGYARHFETASQMARAALDLAIYGLPDTTISSFVPDIMSVSAADVRRVAGDVLRPGACAITVVGDSETVGPLLERLDLPVEVRTPEF
jgi:zinc protease